MWLIDFLEAEWGKLAKLPTRRQGEKKYKVRRGNGFKRINEDMGKKCEKSVQKLLLKCH